MDRDYDRRMDKRERMRVLRLFVKRAGSTAEAAHELQVHRTTMNRWLKAGDLPVPMAVLARFLMDGA